MPLAPSVITKCPRCKVNLILNKPPFKPYSRVIGVYVANADYFGALYWKCPYCRFAFHRWPPNTTWYRMGAEHVYAHNKKLGYLTSDS